jgi:hypothetical protein
MATLLKDILIIGGKLEFVRGAIQAFAGKDLLKP